MSGSKLGAIGRRITLKTIELCTAHLDEETRRGVYLRTALQLERRDEPMLARELLARALRGATGEVAEAIEQAMCRLDQ